MSEGLINPNGQPLKGAVPLGARNLTITLTRDEEKILQLVAASSNTSPRGLAENLFRQSLARVWTEFQIAKLMWECSRWVLWGTARLPS